MARATGLEPATSGVTGRHSNQLSYARAGGPLTGSEERDLVSSPRGVKRARVVAPHQRRALQRAECLQFRLVPPKACAEFAVGAENVRGTAPALMLEAALPSH